jgi:hypothetical protein
LEKEKGGGRRGRRLKYMAVCWHLSPVAKKNGIVGMKLDGVRIL